MEIWVNTTAGTITTSEVKLGTGGPIISYDTDNEDRFSPIISSNCVIPLVIESSIQETFVKQLREVYNERDVYVHLYRATEAQHSTVKPLWSGFVLMDLSSTPDEFYPYDFKITAVDGLGLLKDIDFVKPTTRRANEYIQADMYYGPGRFTYWLKEILLKTGASTTVEGSSQDYEFTTAINWYESLMPNTSQSTDPFYITKCSVGMFHTKTDDGVYEVTNCYEVLKELLKHWGARITYWKGQFWIVQIPQYITPDSGTYINPDNVNTRTYDKSGTFIGSSDNLGDSYWTRYQLNIGDIDGGIQKLTGTNVNYLPQIREVRANNISFGGGNRYGGFPREFAGNSAPDEIIFQDQITDASDSDSFNLVIPLNVNVENGNPFYMKILFNFYCTDLTNTYYLQYDTTLTHKYYWVDISQWTTLVKAPTWDSGFISPATGNSNQSQSHIIEGFDEQILFKLYNTSTQVFSDLDLSGDYKFYLDIDAYGTNISNPGSFRFKFANGGLGVSQFFYPTHPTINVTWTNTLQSNYALQTPNIITNNAPNGNSIIQLTTPSIDPFEGMFVIITNTTGSIYGNSYVSSVNTSDVAIVDFGTLIFGDTLQSSDLGCLQVYNGTSFEKSSSSGNWGVGILTGSLAFTQILLDEYLYGQTVVIESPSMRLVTSEVNKQSSDGSGLRPNYVNPIGRLKESRTNLADVQYVFKRGAFYTLTDEWDYDGFEIKRNVDTIVKTVKNITGPNNPVTGVGSISKTATIPNSFGQVISKQIITSISSSVAAGTITSLPIALINDVVFKIGDYFNVLNSDTNEFIKFELNGQQFSDSSSLTVVSQVIADNIPANSIITFNAFDLTSQYQNKTRGTVGAFDITATSIDSGSVAISSYIDDDTFATASVNSLATSESIKAYVDGQAGHDETLQEVTDNGNTTTNSITIGSSSAPTYKLDVVGGGLKTTTATTNRVSYYNGDGINSYSSSGFTLGNYYNNIIIKNEADDKDIVFKTSIGTASSSEKMRLTSGGNLGLGITYPDTKLEISVATTTITPLIKLHNSIATNDNSRGVSIDFVGSVSTTAIGARIISTRAAAGAHMDLRFHTKRDDFAMIIDENQNVGINTDSPTEKLHVVGDALITGDSHADAFKPAVAANPIKFKNFASTEVARITDGGNLGVGLSNPYSKLIVGTRGTTAYLTPSAIDGLAFDFHNDGPSLSYTRHSAIISQSGDATESVIDFWTKENSGTNSKKITINGNGQLSLLSYGSGSFTGAETYFLAVTSGGDVVEADASALPGGPYLPLIGGTLTGDLQIDGGDLTIIKQNDAPTITLLHDGTNPSTNDLLFKMQFQSDYDGSHQNWGKIEVDTNASSVRTNMDFYVKSLSGAEQLALRFEGQPSDVPNTLVYGSLLIGTTTDNGSKLRILGATSDSTKSALEIRNSSSSALFTVRNDGRIDASGVVNLSGSLTGTSATFSNGFSSDGTAKNYVWRIPNTSSNNGFWYKICRVTSSQSTRFKLQMVGGHSYSDGIYSSEINAYGQLNNDNNYDLTFHQLEKNGQSGSPVISFGQVDVDAASTDLYVRLNTFAELVITASISQGNLYPDSTSTGNSTTPTDFVSAFEQFGMLSNATFAGSLTGTTATFSGQVTIPATPVATTDAASKSYVDAQVGASDTLQEVTDNGNTTTNSIMIGSSSSPSEKLHITGGGSGNLRLDSGGTYYGTYLQAISSLGIKIGNDDYSAFTQIHNDGYQLWNMGGSEKMRLTSGGNLGIGTTAPTAPLQIGATTTAIAISHSDDIINEVNSISIRTDSSANGNIDFRKSGNIYYNTADLSGIRDFTIYEGKDSSNAVLTITGGDNVGNVGIGTTSPSSILDVKKNVSGANQI